MSITFFLFSFLFRNLNADAKKQAPITISVQVSKVETKIK